jgi:glutathione S-transferase
MLKIHHLVLSRSDRIVWLAEELGLRYELVRHVRTPAFRSPESLWAVSPMGKAPVIEDGDVTVSESGAIVEYLLDRYGDGRLRPAAGTREHLAYRHWLHAAEATLALPILIDGLCAMTQTTSPALTAFVQGEYATVLGYLDRTLEAHPYVAGAEFTGADVMVAWDLHFANGTAIPGFTTGAPIAKFPRIVGYLERLEARPAFRKTKELCA